MNGAAQGAQDGYASKVGIDCHTGHNYEDLASESDSDSSCISSNSIMRNAVKLIVCNLYEIEILCGCKLVLCKHKNIKIRRVTLVSASHLLLPTMSDSEIGGGPAITKHPLML